MGAVIGSSSGMPVYVVISGEEGVASVYDRATISPNTAADIVLIGPLSFITSESKQSRDTATTTAIKDAIIDVGHHAKADTITSMIRAIKVYAISLSLVMYEYSFEVDKVHHFIRS
jgi:hypothetical protein